MTTTAPTSESELYYDPWDFGIDADPYPVWKRMRDEAPLYYNEQHDFYAVSRFDDVSRVLKDWETFSSAKGTLIELIRIDYNAPGTIIFEDPEDHDLHRALLTRVFRPRDIAALEPSIRDYCADYLDRQKGSKGFDLVQEFGTQIPMHTIFQLLGVPLEDQVKLRHAIDQTLVPDEHGNIQMADPKAVGDRQSELYREYVEWRAEHPADDIMTELLNAEFTDSAGENRTLSVEEVLGYINLLAAAGNETTTRLISFAGKLLAEHPDQRADLVADPSLIPNAVEELLRFEPPSPAQARYVTKDVEFHGQVVPAGSIMLALNGSANRDERQFGETANEFNIHRKINRHVAFGFGIHFCLGAALARLEGRVALEELLKRFPSWEVDLEHAEQAHTSTVRGWNKLPILLP
ncbi:MAG TPA: cytochrome P450 [Nocardioides sp.]|nr:cytochrome P450 [Nocardioides sp.]